MKKVIFILFVMLLSLEFVGCESVMRKFTRKTKREPIRPVFYQEGMEDTRPHYELYMMHYTYWKAWNDELVNNAGKNFKKDKMAAQGVLDHLADMRKYLIEEKGKELDVYIAQVKWVTDQIIRGGTSTPMRLGNLRQRLGNISSRIARKFYHKDVRDFIIPDGQQ